MKWKVKKPIIGEKRYYRNFALFPTLIGEEFVWLEFFYTEEVFTTVEGWYDEEWIITKRFTKEDYFKEILD